MVVVVSVVAGGGGLQPQEVGLLWQDMDQVVLPLPVYIQGVPVPVTVHVCDTISLNLTHLL